MIQTDNYRTSHPNPKEYTFFSATYLTFFKIHHILKHKANFNRYKKTEVPPCILSDHHGLKMNFNNSRKDRNPRDSWKMNNSLLNDYWVKSEIRRELKVSYISVKINVQHTQTKSKVCNTKNQHKNRRNLILAV